MITEPEVKWSTDQMVEITLNEPDDFLKVRETLSQELGQHPVKRKRYINLVTFFISKEDIILYILKNYLRQMVNVLI